MFFQGMETDLRRFGLYWLIFALLVVMAGVTFGVRMIKTSGDSKKKLGCAWADAQVPLMMAAIVVLASWLSNWQLDLIGDKGVQMTNERRAGGGITGWAALLVASWILMVVVTLAMLGVTGAPTNRSRHRGWLYGGMTMYLASLVLILVDKFILVNNNGSSPGWLAMIFSALYYIGQIVMVVGAVLLLINKKISLKFWRLWRRKASAPAPSAPTHVAPPTPTATRPPTTPRSVTPPGPRVGRVRRGTGKP